MTQPSCSLQGQGDFRPLDEGCGSYTAFRCLDSLKDQNKAGDNLSRKIPNGKGVHAGSWPL